VRADLVVDNANIITIDDERPRASSLAVLGEHIVDVGDGDGLDAVRRIDLGGLTVVPGFNDAHNHMRPFGETLGQVPLSSPPVRAVSDVVDAIARRVDEVEAGEWVVGSNYDHNKLDGGRHPTRHDIDAVSPHNPVVLNHTSGHFCVVNTRAMHLARIGDVAVPEGGVVATDTDGRPTGLLEEQAQQLVRHLLLPHPIEAMVEHLAAASRRYLSEGITSAQEAGVGSLLGSPNPNELAAWQEARQRGVLRTRVTLMISAETLHEIDAHVDDPAGTSLDLGLRSGFGDDWLRIGPTKVFADGSLMGRTAAMFDDFAGEPGNAGYFQMDPARLRKVIIDAHTAGWQVATHAIGDRAVATTLDIYTEALRLAPRADHRHRIEHCGVCRPADVARMAGMGVIPTPQGRFISEIGDGMMDALGPERVANCYRQRSFLQAGIVLAGSSDRPVVNGAPLLGIHDLVNQRTAGGQDFNPHEALEPIEALRAYTLGSAHASFDEHRKGSLTPGKLADLVVLDRDPTAIDRDGIAETQVVATMIGGQFAHDPQGLGA